MYSRRHNTALSAPSSPSDPPDAKNLEYFQVGTVLATSRGAIVVERVREGDIVLRPDGLWHRVIWICNTHQDLVGAAPRAPVSLDGSGVQKTRFSGIRFVRGTPASRLYQVIFAPMPQKPQTSETELSPEFKPIPESFVKKTSKAEKEPGPVARAPSFISVRTRPKSRFEVA